MSNEVVGKIVITFREKGVKSIDMEGRVPPKAILGLRYQLQHSFRKYTLKRAMEGRKRKAELDRKEQVAADAKELEDRKIRREKEAAERKAEETKTLGTAKGSGTNSEKVLDKGKTTGDSNGEKAK